MISHNTEEKLLTAAQVGLAILPIVFFVVMGVKAARLDADCLRAGYPNSKMTWNLEGYCVKRVDQTDTVVPIDTVRGR